MPLLGILQTLARVSVGIDDVRYRHDEEKPEPCFEIVECLPEVVPSPVTRNNPHLVGAEPLDGDDFLTVGS